MTATISHAVSLTMVRLKPHHRRVLAEKLPDAANVALAGLVIGQAVSDRPFSRGLALAGATAWIAFMVFAMLFAPEDKR